MGKPPEKISKAMEDAAASAFDATGVAPMVIEGGYWALVVPGEPIVWRSLKELRGCDIQCLARAGAFPHD